jgi:type IV secretion system protein VirD4
MTVYVGLPANRIGEVGLLANLFFSELIELNTDVLPEQDATIRHQCLMVLDEFIAMGYVKHFDKANAFIAGYWLRMLTILQSVAQAQDPKAYGTHGAQTLVVNHDVHIVYPPKDQKEAQAVSESLGYLTEKAVSTGRNMGKSSSRSENTSDQRRALMLAQELKAMTQDEEIVLGFPNPIHCKKAYFYEDPLFIDRLKAMSPSLAKLGDAMPSEDQLKAAMMAGELSSSDVPVTDLAEWHVQRDIGRAQDERRSMTAAERLALDAEELHSEVVVSAIDAMAEHEFRLTGVRSDVAELLSGLNLPSSSEVFPEPNTISEDTEETV